MKALIFLTLIFISLQSLYSQEYGDTLIDYAHEGHFVSNDLEEDIPAIVYAKVYGLDNYLTTSELGCQDFILKTLVLESLKGEIESEDSILISFRVCNVSDYLENTISPKFGKRIIDKEFIIYLRKYNGSTFLGKPVYGLTDKYGLHFFTKVELEELSKY